MIQRQERHDQLSQQPLNVLVVGGGIVGSAIARDAAMRGLRTGLVEQSDFASGTSSRSARLLHGGLRYLAQGNVRLVRQASLEKLVIKRIAPHLAEGMPFVFPTYRGTPWPRWKLRMGVKVYDWLCNGQNFGRSSTMNKQETIEHLPMLERKDLTGAVRYFDGVTNDARLVLDTLRSAERHGAIVCNYVKVITAQRENSRWRCELHDVVRDVDMQVTADVVVNATGPWAGGFTQSQLAIRGTKGVHVVLDHQRLPIDEAVMMSEGPRVVWAVPWGQRVYVGCTDTDYRERLEDVKTEPQDIDYLLSVVSTAFPAANLSEADVLRTWAGVRPLIAANKGGPSDVSRSHEIRTGEPGWLDVAGGKLTTCRLMGQEVVDRIGGYLRRDLPPCRTAVDPLLDKPCENHISGVRPPAVSKQAVQACCHNEWSVHLDDVMVRRTRWHYYEAEPLVVAQQAVTWMGESLHWDEARQQAELQRYQQYRD